MCGICGIFQFDGQPVSESLLDKMCRTMIHRGPDGQGIYTSHFIGLGQRRLAIIDLSQRGQAPLSNEDESVWVVLNGEIYNFQELRADLTKKGHIFKSATDTEVIVHLYEEYGIDCLERMRGMFAFALWDKRQKRLFIARDRLGKKPLFYTNTGSSLVFGSKIEALTLHPRVSVAPDFRAIDSYLRYQYVPSPQTAFEGISKLQPGHFLMCDATGTVKIQRYWSPPEPVKTTDSEAEISNRLLETLQEAVRLRLISDVPVGAFLSGGIDSGLIVALMAQQSSKPVKTFSIGFEEEAFNELPYARQVAQKYETEHHEFVVRPNAIEILPLLVRHYNEPFADSSALPTYYVSQMTRQHVTVALSGDGGDENFAGYSHYEQVMNWQKSDVVPYFLRHLICRPLGAIMDMWPYNRVTARASKGLNMLGSNLPQRYLQQITIVKQQERNACYTSNYKQLLSEQKRHDLVTHLPWNSSMNSLDWMMRHDQNFYLPDCLMVKSDVASMANSLELRCPLLDHKFVELAATIPSSMKRQGSNGKILLKKVASPFLPSAVLNKPKTGFGLPLAQWFREDLAPLVKATLLDSTAVQRDLFQPAFMKKIIDEHISGHRDWSTRLWTFLFLEMWFREFID